MLQEETHNCFSEPNLFEILRLLHTCYAEIITPVKVAIFFLTSVCLAICLCLSVYMYVCRVGRKVVDGS